MKKHPLPDHVEELENASAKLIAQSEKDRHEITRLHAALVLILEVHPTRNSLETYAAAVREIAADALKGTPQ